MFGIGDSFNFSQPQPSQSSACFDIQQELKTPAYCITFEFMKEHEIILSALSDYSLLFLDANTMKSINHIPEAHMKRINGLHFSENVLYTCSNDGSIKVWDIKAGNSPVAQFKSPSAQELYCLSQTKQILAGGVNGKIHFWDLRLNKLLKTFEETHGEEVTSLQFAEENPSILLSASLDGLVCLFDLSKGDEEDAADTVLRLEQPVNTCKFFTGTFNTAYAQTTVQTIGLLSLEEAKIVQEVNPIENLDSNQFALLNAYDFPNETNLYYLRGNLEGYIEEYAINLLENAPAAFLNKYHTLHVGPLTKAQRITNEHIISSGEDCKFYLTPCTKVDDVFDFEHVKNSMFLEDESATDTTEQSNKNQRGKQNRRANNNFDPY